MAHGTAVVGANKLNVRADPSTTAAIIGQLAPSELVTVWALSDGWAIVQAVSGLTGWAVAEYMTVGELVA